MKKAQTHPWLLVSQGQNLQSHILYDASKNEHLKRNIPEFRNKQISSTSYGWVALIDVEKSPLRCCLMNTESKEKIQLPDIEVDPKSERGYECILSKPPTHPNCHVLFLSSYDDSLFFCRLGDEKFIKRTRNFGGHLFIAATNYNEKVIAYICRSGNFVEIDFVGQELIPKQLMNNMGQPCQIPWPSPSTSFMFNDYLVEYSSGDLLLVHLICLHHTDEVAYFRIFKVNECLELRSIGDRTIFLGAYGSMCSSSSEFGIKKNSIYYIWKDRYLYVYDIEDRSHTLIKPCSFKRGGISLMSWVMM